MNTDKADELWVEGHYLHGGDGDKADQAEGGTDPLAEAVERLSFEDGIVRHAAKAMYGLCSHYLYGMLRARRGRAYDDADRLRLMTEAMEALVALHYVRNFNDGAGAGAGVEDWAYEHANEVITRVTARDRSM